MGGGVLKLPIILAGPILRRVETSSITIWIAVSCPFQISAKVFIMNTDVYQIDSKCLPQTIQLGKNLYIYLLKLTPLDGEFPGDTLLGYNLYFNNNLNLGDFGLLDPNDSHSIVYGDLQYPSFYIQQHLDSNVLYGSCRKLHGEGNDALVAGDLEIQSSYNHLSKRPNALFLLGDQIYADDVADPLSPILSTLSQSLMGCDEKLSILDNRLAEAPFYLSLNRINGREYIMNHFCRFTSRKSQNHLMKFGEYAAMYLLSWGPVLWETIQKQGGLSTFDEVIDNNQLHFVFPQTNQYLKEHKVEHGRLKKRFERQSDDLRQIIPSLHCVRRLLANVPTYMIFDDHDITDDWNLSKEWKDNVTNSPLGKHVVANGLGAYWAFQGWGSSPSSFDQHFITKMEKYFSTLAIGSNAHSDWVNCLWSFNNWHYIAPTSPKTVFLDTRTQRKYDSRPKPVKFGMTIHENVRSPQLVSNESWRLVSESLRSSGWRRKERLIIASPTPLYGMGLIESALTNNVYPLRAFGIPVHEVIDYEAWKYNGRGFSEFLKWIFKWNPSGCIIISGDAHFASSVRTSIQTTFGKEATIVQLTSSPMNNMSFTGIWGMLLKSTIWLNSIKRKEKNIVRFCDNTYTIHTASTHTPCPSNYLWRETLHYLSTDKESIIQTNNNLGLFSVSQGEIKNKLLHMKNFEEKDESLYFESIQLPDRNSKNSIKYF